MDDGSRLETMRIEARLAVLEARVDYIDEPSILDIRDRSAGEDGLDLSKFAFGIKKQTTSSLTLNPGIFAAGKEVYPVEETTIQIPSGSFFVLITHNKNIQDLSYGLSVSGGVSINVSSVIPANTNNIKNIPLYQFESTDGIVSLKYIHHLGSIYLL